MSRISRDPILALAVLVLAAFVGCSEEPVGPELSETGPSLAKGGPPSSCNAGANLSITFGDALGDALQGDGDGAYVEAVENVGAHINDPTGNLMLWTSQYGATRRLVNVTTTAGTFPTKDRIYTNNHENSCGLGGMAFGITGSAVLEAELNDPDGVDNGIVRYGKDCSGAVLSGNKVVTTRSTDGNTWTISGTSGIHCRQPEGQKKPGFAQVGTAGPFSMTLVKIGA